MNARTLRRLGALVTLALLGALVAGPRVSAHPAAPAHDTSSRMPNIVFILVDDMRQDELQYMPSTRRLIGGRGATFVNSFAPYPLCCPARASILTGLYTHNHGVLDSAPPYGFTSFDDRSTIATWLQHGGYTTTLVGKYLNGYGDHPVHGSTSGDSLHYVPPGWSTWRASIDAGLPPGDPLAGGTYRYYDTTLSTDGEGFVNYRGQYQTDVYGDLAQEIIQEDAAYGRPFFLYLAFSAPHGGRPVEPDDPPEVRRNDGRRERFATPARPRSVRGTFDDVITASPGATWRDPDFTDKPQYLRNLPPLNRQEWRVERTVARQRAEALSVVDQQVPRLIDALRRSGQLASTLIVFTSDNGYFLGEQHKRQGKILPHEPSLRVPLLVRGPAIPSGVVRRDPITSIDLAPTFADFAGITPETAVDGESLLGVARSGDQGWTRAILTETGPMLGVVRDTDDQGDPLEPGEQADVRYLLGIRTDRYLYVDAATGEEELYDLRRDPQEYRNLVLVPRYSTVLDELRHVLHEMRACAGPGCRVPLPPDLQAGP